jgi:octaprenyl-diphosphate synthase
MSLPSANSAVTPAASASRPDIDGVRALIGSDMEAVNRLIQHRLRSDVALIDQLGAYIIQNGGKRLRPATVLLSAGAFSYDGDAHVTLAAVIEFIHTATLLHDDVVDASSMRRGQATANEVWGNQASVLVGDFLYSRAFEMMVEVGEMRIMEILAGTTNTIAEGEVMQLMNAHVPDTSEEQYFATIRCKTAKLFEAAARLGAVISGQSAAVETSMARYGMSLGNAFQLIDDVLDYTADSAELGKNVGDDLAEGKPTLPLIRAMQTGTEEQRALIRSAIEHGAKDNIDQVIAAIESSGALAYTCRRAEEQATAAKQALAGIPDSRYRRALLDLADFAVQRSF